LRLPAVMLFLLAALSFAVVRASAEDNGIKTHRSHEVWLGAEATERAWSIYSGLTWAPLGSIDSAGLRFRASGGSGSYHYRGTIYGAPASIYGTPAFADLLVGYQMGFGPLTLKAFVGASFDRHWLEPYDTANALAGQETGVKAAVEGWLNLTSKTWVALDLAATAAHASYNSRLRLGYRALPDLSLGLEAGGFGNVAGDSRRIGGLIRYEWRGGEISVSGGITKEIHGERDPPSTPYVAMTYLTKF
jgi:hypothetical protein